MLNIKELREEKNLTQTQLAELIGVSMRTIQNWESGDKNITVSKLLKLNKALGVNTNPFSSKEQGDNDDKSKETLLYELKLKDEIISLYKEKIENLENKIKLFESKNNEVELLDLVKEIHHVTMTSAINEVIKENERDEARKKEGKRDLEDEVKKTTK